MKIQLQQKITATKEVDVEFPIYRRHSLDNFTVFTKIESPKNEIIIYLYRDERKVEIEICEPSFIGDEEYLFGLGQYSCSESQFKSASLFAKDLMSALG